MSFVTPWPGPPPAALLAAWGDAPELELGPAVLLGGVTALDGIARALEDGEVDLACCILVRAYPTEEAFRRYYGISWRDAAAVLQRALAWAAAHPTWAAEESVLWMPLLRVYERLGFCDGVAGLTARPADAVGPAAPPPEVPPSASRDGLTWRISVGVGRAYDRARARGAAEARLHRDAPAVHAVFRQWARRLRHATHRGRSVGAVRRRGQRALARIRGTLPYPLRPDFDRLCAAWVRDTYRWEAAATATAVEGTPCTITAVWQHWQRHTPWRTPSTGTPTRAARALTAELRVRLAGCGVTPDTLRAAEAAERDTALDHLRASDHGGAAQVRRVLTAAHRRVAGAAFLGAPAWPGGRASRHGLRPVTPDAPPREAHGPATDGTPDVAQLSAWLLTTWPGPRPWPVAPSAALAAADLVAARRGEASSRRASHAGSPILPPRGIREATGPATTWSADRLARRRQRALRRAPAQGAEHCPDLVARVRAERECIRGGEVALLGTAEQWARGYALEAAAHQEDAPADATADALTWAADAIDAALEARATTLVMTTIVQRLVGRLPGGYTAPDARSALLALVRAEAPRVLQAWETFPPRFAERCRRRAGYDVLAWLLDEWALITWATTPSAAWPAPLGGAPSI